METFAQLHEEQGLVHEDARTTNMSFGGDGISGFATYTLRSVAAGAVQATRNIGIKLQKIRDVPLLLMQASTRIF